MMKVNNLVSIIIPCYNTSNKILNYARNITNILNSNDFVSEIIFVEDSTPDNLKTWKLICSVVQEIPNSKCFQMSKNIGQQKAILAGIQQSKGGIVVTIDDDCQHDLNYLIPMIKGLKDYDLVIAKLESRKVSMIRSFGTYLVKLLAKKIFKPEKDMYFSSYRAIEGDLARKSSKFPSSNPVVSFEIMRLTNKVTNIVIEQKDSSRDRSTYSFSNLINYFFTIILTYTNIVQSLFIKLSFFIAFLSLSLLVWYLIKYFSGGIGIPGFASIIMVISAFASLTFFGIGILMTVITKIDNKLNRSDWYNFTKSFKN